MKIILAPNPYRDKQWYSTKDENAVFITMSMHISSLAASPPERTFICCTARTPSGVAALPSPSRFALRLPQSAPAQISSSMARGKSRRRSGLSPRASRRLHPLTSSSAAKPDHRQSGPASVSARRAPSSAPRSSAAPANRPVSREEMSDSTKNRTGLS